MNGAPLEQIPVAAADERFAAGLHGLLLVERVVHGLVARVAGYALTKRLAFDDHG
jgi:hypothetical protein